MLEASAAQIIVMPAYEFHPSKLFPDQIKRMKSAAAGQDRPLVVFTSPRSVEYGLIQIPPEVLQSALVAAIGPSTSSMLQAAGVEVTLRPEGGFTSEDLLTSLSGQGQLRGGRSRSAFIIAAPGGRTALLEGLQALGFETQMLMVYGRKSADLSSVDVAAITEASAVLSVWTSANAMNSLSQRLPARCWSKLCRGDWLVISERLQRVARAFSPRKIHLASGPTNSNIARAIKAL